MMHTGPFLMRLEGRDLQGRIEEHQDLGVQAGEEGMNSACFYLRS